MRRSGRPRSRNRGIRSRNAPRSYRGYPRSRARRINNLQTQRRSARLAGLSAETHRNPVSPSSFEHLQTSEGENIESNSQELDQRYLNLQGPIEGERLVERYSMNVKAIEQLITTSRNLTPARDSNGNRNHRINMNLIVQPPSEIRPGDLLNPPIVVKLESQHDSHTIGDVDTEIENLWAQASVVSEDGMVALAPPEPNLISGTLVHSVQSVTPEEESQELGYLTFPNLAFHQTGNFRIRISLVRMPGADEFEAINVQSIVTRVIKVDRDANTPSLGM